MKCDDAVGDTDPEHTQHLIPVPIIFTIPAKRQTEKI